MVDHYDVIVIGSGAGGGTLVHRLAPGGRRILILERGDWLAREPQNWLAESVFGGRYTSTDTWYDDEGEPFRPEVHYFVGGATKLYAAALYRLRAEDFEELEHHDGPSPAWPISYDEMAPYYTEGERLYQVHGTRGEDPTEPAADAPYPYPAVSHEPRIQQLSDDLLAAGHQPFHAPCGVMLDESDQVRSACVRCDSCDRFPCPVRGKCDADVIAVQPALEHPNVDILTGATALRLLTNPAGTTVKSVRFERDSRAEEVSSDLVVVSCGAANSAKLLLASANDRHPGGLANRSDQVGRNFMFHDSDAVIALSREPNPTVFQKTLGLNDFYFASDEFPFPLGNIQMVGRSHAAMYRDPTTLRVGLDPRWNADSIAAHAVDFMLTIEDLPRPENRVTLDRGAIKLSYRHNNDEPRRRLLEKLRSLLGKIGMHPDLLIPHPAYVKTEAPLAGVAHQAGTCRFGRDPETSVLDENCRAHDLDNLYVVDTSFFPSVGALNPALTAIANALRVGDHLRERLGDSPPEPVGDQATPRPLPPILDQR
jgi:choline dehydrogenase-like flavoprotein